MLAAISMVLSTPDIHVTTRVTNTSASWQTVEQSETLHAQHIQLCTYVFEA